MQPTIKQILVGFIKNLRFNLIYGKFLRILKIPKIYTKFSQKWQLFSKFQQYLKLIVFFNFCNIFLVVFLTFPLISSKFLYTFIFLRLHQNFLENKKLYLKSAPILLIITKISWNPFSQFLKFPLNFYWNYLKFFQKLLR